MKYKTEEERKIGYASRHKRYGIKNRERIIALQRKWYEEHPNYRREYFKKHYIKKVRIDKRPELNCGKCDSVFRLFPSRIKYGAKYCSKTCYLTKVKKYRSRKEQRLASSRRQNERLKIERVKKRINERAKNERLRKRLLTKFVKVVKSIKREKWLVYRESPEYLLLIKQRKAKAKKGHSSKGVSKKVFEEIKKEYGYKCVFCKKREPFPQQYWPLLTQDHIIPRSKGGKKRSRSNIQPLCWDCNIKKSNNEMWDIRQSVIKF